MTSRSLKMSPAGVALLMKFQGLSLEKYRDENGLWVIGYGHIITPEDNITGSISVKVAEKLLQDDLAKCEKMLHQILTPSVTQTQYDSLVSLIFSGGISTALLTDIVAELTVNNQAMRV